MTSEGELADSAAPRRDLIHAVTVGLVGLGGRDTGLALGGAAVGIRLLGNVVLALVARREVVLRLWEVVFIAHAVTIDHLPLRCQGVARARLPCFPRASGEVLRRRRRGSGHAP